MTFLSGVPFRQMAKRIAKDGQPPVYCSISIAFRGPAATLSPKIE
jgi:hypothetical protein